MKISQIKKGLILVTIVSGTLAVGCELIVDFDRTKIPVETTEASVPDATTPEEASSEAGAEAGDADATTPVADADAGAQGAQDADADADN
jgi:hypothetical protein